jgi:hypothetical protein
VGDLLPVIDDGDDEDSVGHEGDGAEANVNSPPPSFAENQFLVILRKLNLVNRDLVRPIHDQIVFVKVNNLQKSTGTLVML